MVARPGLCSLTGWKLSWAAGALSSDKIEDREFVVRLGCEGT
jgi:hypothetical protein